MLKKYQLTILFVATAVVAIASAIAIVNAIIGRRAVDNLVGVAEENAKADAMYLMNLVKREIVVAPLRPQEDISQAEIMSRIANLRLSIDDLTGPRGLPSVIPTLPEGLNFIEYNVFKPNGAIVWSTNPQDIGKVSEEQTFHTLPPGGVVSQFQRDHDFTDLRGNPKRGDVVETYISAVDPVTGEEIAVMEVYKEVTNEVSYLVDDTKETVLRTTAGTLGGLFLVLFGFVATGNVQINRSRRREVLLAAAQAEERSRMQEALRKEEDQRRQAEEKAVMAELGRLVSSPLEVQRLYAPIAREVGKIIPFDHARIVLVGVALDSYVTVFGTGIEVARPTSQTPGPSHCYLTDGVVQKRTALVVQEDAEQTLLERYPALGPEIRAGLKSFLAVPLLHDGKVIGVLHLQSCMAQAYTGQHADIAASVCSQIGAAIINAQLQAEQQRTEQVIQELSTPVLPIGERLLLLPLIGLIDSERIAQMTARLLAAVRASKARAVVVDLTGAVINDVHAANSLVRCLNAARLMGAAAIITGASVEMTGKLVSLGVDLSKVISTVDLQSGIEEAAHLVGPLGLTPVAVANEAGKGAAIALGNLLISRGAQSQSTSTSARSPSSPRLASK